MLIYEAFTLKCRQLQQAVRMGDDRLVRVLDRELEPLIAEAIEYKAESVFDMHLQLQFISDLISGSAGDRSSVIRYSAMLSMLLERYFGTPDPDREDMPMAWPAVRSIVGGERDELNEVILDSLPDRVAVFTPDYRYLYTNLAYSSLLGCSPIDLVGRHITDFAEGLWFEDVLKPALDRCFLGEAVDFICHPGAVEVQAVRCRMSPLKGRSASVMGAIVQFQDACATSDGREAA